MTTELVSKRYAVDDPGQAIELCFEKGWTDGLPVVPPTESRVRAMLDAVGLAAQHQVAYITNRQVAVTAEKVAINAVMAGCRPEYMPVVVAAIEGIGDPRWGYHGPATSTGGAGVLMIVNGPIARALEFNSGDNLFGPGWRANATVGRAVRLVMRNAIGTLPGKLDRGTLGHSGQVQLRDRRERDGEPVDAAPRGARLPARAERGDRHGGAGAASVLQPALEHGGGRADDRVRCHAQPRHGRPAKLLPGAGRRAHAHDRCGRLVQGGYPEVRLREQQEQRGALQADGPDARRGQARGRVDDAAAGDDAGRHPGGSGWRACRARSPATSRAGGAGPLRRQ